MSGNKESDQNNILKGYNMLLYFAGSMIMYEPVEECITDFLSNDIIKSLPVSSGNPRFMEAASQLRNSCENLLLCRQMLQDDFNRLFSDGGLSLALPFKSNHESEDQKRSKGNGSVSDFYNSYGWKFRSRYNTKDDHLGIELLFLTLLTDKYVSFDDEVSRGAMKSEIKRFMVEHIFSWVPEWNKKVQEFAATNCYKGIALLIYASCEDIYKILDNEGLAGQNGTETKN